MISTAYLHEHDILDSFMEETYHIMNDVYDATNKLIAAENYVDEQVFMGESADDYQVMLEETKKNVFAIIGEKVIEFIKTVVATIGKFGASIGEHLKGLKKHAGDEALKEQMRNNPELAKKFIEAVMSGNIKLHDVKDMDDLLKTAQELTDQLMSGKIDEQKYMDKVDDKLNKYANRAKNITAILGVVIGTTGILAAVNKLGVGGKDVEAQAIATRGDYNVMKEKMMREANAEAGGKTNRLAVWLKGQQKIIGAIEHDYSGWRSVLAKAEGKLGDIVGKVNTGYVRKNNDAPLKRKAERERNARSQARQAERDKQAVIDEFNRGRERRNAQQRQAEKQEERNHQNQTYHQRQREAYATAYTQQNARNQADEDWNVQKQRNQQRGTGGRP